MSRKNIYSIVASLLCLISVTIKAQTLTRYEYWFDDDYANRESGSLTGSESVVNTSVETEGLSNGIHKINFRAQQSDGKYSAVTTSFFFKLDGGEATHLEYWVDNDIAHSKIIEGKLASDGKDYIFVSDLDLGNISPGHHRLYCRAVNSSKTASSAITMTPVMVKAYIGGDAKLMQYTIAVDNETPKTFGINENGSDLVISQSIDVNQLPVGDHTLKMSFWNTYYNSVTDSATFHVSTSAFKLETPNPEKFKATDITESGFTATWDAVEGALYYDILVKQEGGDYEKPVFQGGSSGTSIKVIGLDPSTSYYFQIRARNDNRNEASTWSKSIPEAVVTSAMGTLPANLVIQNMNGFDGANVLYKDYSYHYKVWIDNNGTSPWNGSFFLKDGDEDVKGWYSVSIPSNGAHSLEFDYIPKTIGEKDLILYYQTAGRGRGIPVETTQGTDNVMKIVVSSDPTFSTSVQLAEAISCPQTLNRGETVTLSAAIKNFGENDWSGTLYLVDNGITLEYKTATLKPGKGKKLYAEWTPETAGSHEITVYYKTDNGFVWSPIYGGGFTNPVAVDVLATDAMENANYASITHVTKDVVPKEVTEGSKVFYYFRLTDDKGNRLKGVRMKFKCEGSNYMNSIETTLSGSDGIVELCLDTEGSNKIADRGETVKLTCTALLKDNNETIGFAYEPEDGEIQLKVHQGTEASKESGFENVEKVKFSLTPGLSIKGGIGNYAKWNAGVSLPMSFSAKFDDNGEFKNFTLDTKIKGSAKGSIGEYDKQKNAENNGNFAPLPSASIGVSGGYHYSCSSDDYRGILIRLFMSWCENYVLSDNKFVDKSIKTLMEWYAKKNHINETRNWFIGGELGISLDFLNIEIPSIIKRNPKIPFMKINELGLDGKFNLDYDFMMVKNDNSKNRTLTGDAYSVKLGGSFDAKATMGNIFDDTKLWWKTIVNHGFCSTQVSNYFNQSTIPQHKSSHSLSMKSEEYLDSKNKYLELTHSMSLTDGWEMAFSDLKIPSVSFDASCGGKSTSSFKLSSKEEWATYIGDIVNSSSKDKDLAYLLYPQLKHSYLFSSPGEIFGFWNRPPIGALQKLASKAPDPSKYKLKDAFKVEHTLSSEVSVGVKIPIAEWLNLTVDVDASVELENKPTESYYSITDNRFMPVSIHPTTTTDKIIKWAFKKVLDKMVGLFDDDRNEIEPIYVRMQDVYGAGSVNNMGTYIDIPGLPRYEKVEIELPTADDNDSQGGGGGGGTSSSPKNTNGRYHYGLRDFNSDYARYIIGRNPRLGEKVQSDICSFTFGFNNEEQNFDEGIQLKFPHYYPAGSLIGITDEGDTLFVVSEVVDVEAYKGDEVLSKTQRGEFEITGNVGVDDLTPFGFSDDHPLDVYYSEADSNIWHYVGPAGIPLKFDKCGSFMMATSIKNDKENPQIFATLDELTGLIHINVTDNIGIDLSTLQVFVNGEHQEVLMINQSNFELQLPTEAMEYMVVVNVKVQDLAGNEANLLQMFNLDKPDNTTDVSEKLGDNKTEIFVKNRVLKVKGAKPGTLVSIYSVNGLLQGQVLTETNGKAQFDLSHLLEGVYVVTTSDGKSMKFQIK